MLSLYCKNKTNMNKNIFEGAKFGDKFQTKNGKMAILIFPHYYQNTTVKLCIEDGDEFDVYLDGQVDTRFWNDDLSIEGKWKESIDEDKLDELAKNTQQYDNGNNILYKDPQQVYYAEDLDIVFKTAYRIAKSEV